MHKTFDTNWPLLDGMIAQSAFLTARNPVVANLTSGSMTSAQGTEVLRQYYYLVVTIVQFLTIAMVRIPVAQVKKELRRNLNEELGSRTKGQTHQELFEKLLLKELGIDVRTEWSEATKTFICTLLLNMNTQSPHFVAGMIYALEATACPELKVVARILNLATKREVVNIQALEDRSPLSNLNRNHEVTTLKDFLALHTLDFEVSHESGLRTTLEPFVGYDWQMFYDGFKQVLNLMQVWWQGLATP